MAPPRRRTMFAVMQRHLQGTVIRLGARGLLYVGAGALIFSDSIVRTLATTLALLLDIAEVNEVRTLLYGFTHFLASAWVLGFLAIPACAVAVLGMRAGARYRLAAGHADPLERPRRFLAAHPVWLTFLTALPGLAISASLMNAFSFFLRYSKHPYSDGIVRLFLPALITFAFATFMARKGVRALVAPTEDRLVEGVAGTELDAEGFGFDAVAITPHTLGAVAAMVALTVGVLAVTVSSRLVHALHEKGMVALLGAYCTIALGGAYLFARRSRIAIGLDGVLVGGTTRQRFVAYRDIDHVRVIGDIIELRTRTSALLRLQLHGEDAGRRVAIVERLEAAIERARTLRADPTAAFMENASADDLARAADGASSYRFAAPSRDKLWEVFESPVLAPQARRAAAEALASGIDASERPRFRIAADQIAEPATRERLQELLGDEQDDVPPSARAMRLPA